MSTMFGELFWSLIGVFFLPARIGEWIKDQYGAIAAGAVAVVLLMITIGAAVANNNTVLIIVAATDFIYILGIWPDM